jgi:regulator of sigma E protease
MLITLLIAFFSLILLMIIHEFGHFIIAKKFGVKVEEFGIGYPPRLFGKQFGETLYSVNLIPLGAFVKIQGEEGGVDDIRSFSNLAMWKRMLIVLGGVIAFWIAAIVIFSVLFGLGAKVPVGDQDLVESGDTQVQIMAVEQGSPADVAGLKVQDVLTNVKSQRYESAGAGPEILTIDKIGDFQSFVNAHGGEQLQLFFLRDGRAMDVAISPRISPGENQGALGISLERMATVIKQYPFYQAPWQGLKFTWEVTIKSLQGIAGVLVNLFTGKGVPSGAELAGPVGITIFLANAASYGLGFFLYFIGSISVLVAIFNLFPIPALDGGKLVFLTIEKVMGKPVPVKWEQIITVTFFVLLIAMSLFVTIKFDIPRVIDFWKAGL